MEGIITDGNDNGRLTVDHRLLSIVRISLHAAGEAGSVSKNFAPFQSSRRIKGTGLFYICPTVQRLGGNHQDSLPKRSCHIRKRGIFWLERPKRRDRAQRKPILLLMLSGAFLFRFVERTLLSLLFHAPPRSTRSGVPKLHGLQPAAE